jgi:hypothetical protein
MFRGASFVDNAMRDVLLFALVKALQDRRAPWYLRGFIRKPLREIGMIVLHDVEHGFLREIAMVLRKEAVHGRELIVGHGRTPGRRQRPCISFAKPFPGGPDIYRWHNDLSWRPARTIKMLTHSRADKFVDRMELPREAASTLSFSQGVLFFERRCQLSTT